MKFGVYFFFGGWVIIMTMFIYFFLPGAWGDSSGSTCLACPPAGVIPAAACRLLAIRPASRTPGFSSPPRSAPLGLPAETAGVPIEEVQLTFARHPLWRKVMGSAADEVIAASEERDLVAKQGHAESAST